MTETIQLIASSLEFLFDTATQSAKVIDTTVISPLKHLYDILSILPGVGDKAAYTLGTIAGIAVPLAGAFTVLNPLIQTSALVLNMLYLKALVTGEALSGAAIMGGLLKASLIALAAYGIVQVVGGLIEVKNKVRDTEQKFKDLGLTTEEIQEELKEFNKRLIEGDKSITWVDKLTFAYLSLERAIKGAGNALGLIKPEEKRSGIGVDFDAYSAQIAAKTLTNLYSIPGTFGEEFKPLENLPKTFDDIATAASLLNEELNSQQLLASKVMEDWSGYEKILKEYETNVLTLKKALKSGLFTDLFQKKDIEDSIKFFENKIKALGRTKPQLKLLELEDISKDVDGIRGKFQVVDKAIRDGMFRSMDDVNELTKSIGNELGKLGVSPAFQNFYKLSEQLKVSGTIKEDFRTLGELIYSGLLKNGEQATSIYYKLRNNMLLSGVRESVANISGQVAVLGGVMSQSEKAASEWVQIDGYIRQGLLTPTTEVINRMKELKGEIVGVTKVSVEFNSLMARQQEIKGYESNLKTLSENFNNFNEVEKSKAKDLVAFYAQQIAEARTVAGNYVSAWKVLEEAGITEGMNIEHMAAGANLAQEIKNSTTNINQLASSLQQNTSNIDDFRNKMTATLYTADTELAKVFDKARKINIDTADAYSKVNEISLAMGSIPPITYKTIVIQTEYRDAQN